MYSGVTRPSPLGKFNNATLKAYGMELTPAMVAKGLESFWKFKAAGELSSSKMYVPLDRAKLWEDSRYAHLKERFEGIDFEFRYNALEGTVRGITGVKDVYSNTVNSHLGLPRQVSNTIVRELVTGNEIGSIESTDHSNARTWLPLDIMMEKFFPGDRKVIVTLIGSGPVNAWCARMLNYKWAHKVATLSIISRPRTDGSKSSSEQLMEFLKGLTGEEQIKFPIFAYTQNTCLQISDLVVLGAGADHALWKEGELYKGAKVLNLAGRQCPESHIQQCLTLGRVACDSIPSCEKRGGQSLQRYLEEREGLTLTQATFKYDIKELATMLPLPEHDNLPYHVTAVGQASADIMLVAYHLLLLSEILANTTYRSTLRISLGIDPVSVLHTQAPLFSTQPSVQPST